MAMASNGDTAAFEVYCKGEIKAILADLACVRAQIVHCTPNKDMPWGDAMHDLKLISTSVARRQNAHES